MNDLEQTTNKIREIILNKNDWMEVFEIAEILGVHRYDKLLPDVHNSTIGQLINRYLKKEGFVTKKVYYDDNYSIWVAPPAIVEVELDTQDTKQNQTGYKKSTIVNPEKVSIKALTAELKNQEYTQIIKECIRYFNGKFGISSIAKILNKTKSKKFQFEYIINSDFYGKLNHLTLKRIQEIITALIDTGEIIQSGGLRPTLSIYEPENIHSDKYKDIDICDLKPAEFTENKPLRNQMEKELFKIFGFKSFHDNQWQVIQKLLNKERVLLIEKTGYGKSLCYQFPAKLFYDKGEGLTLVFSPLIALMRDQINKLNEIGINAESINSDQNTSDNRKVLARALKGEIAILFIAPERLSNDMFQLFIREIKLAMIVIDEAHCITVWGHDFRPAYKRIMNIVKLQPLEFPILALTATATELVEKDIRLQMGKEFNPLRGELLRRNLSLWVINVNSEEEKFLWLAKHVKNLPGTGIIYSGTQKNTEIYSAWLNHNGVNSTFYHASIPAESKEKIEFEMLNNQRKCIISTNALGMGIDKPDIRFIIHTHIPASPIHYYQEIGRAGRDGKRSFIILFFSPDDKSMHEYFIENSRAPEYKYQKALDLLKKEPLDEQSIKAKLYLTDIHSRLLIADLINQNLINENNYEGKKIYEIQLNSNKLDTEFFHKIKQFRYYELKRMMDYVNYRHCRMKYLCAYLGDSSFENCNQCDNDRDEHRHIELTQEWEEKINKFLEEYTPILDVENHKTRLINGIAASYYGSSKVGKIIHKCKYENGGDFPDVLLQKTLKAFHKTFSHLNFDLIIFVPPTESGTLVKHFVEKLSKELNIPISYKLEKIKITDPLKTIKSRRLKAKILRNAFRYDQPSELTGKNILLIDDIFDSGTTIIEIARLLSLYKANLIAPLVIAKTNKGDI